MPRRRMIDPNFWESEDIAKLTPRQRLLWIGLWSNADDEGRGRGSLAAIRSTVFKYDDLTLQDLASDLEAIKAHCKVQFYEVDGSLYYACLGWDVWQKVDHPKPSFIPPPQYADLLANDSRMPRDTIEPNLIKSNLIESKGLTIPAAAKALLHDNIPQMDLPAVRGSMVSWAQRMGWEMVTEALRRGIEAKGKQTTWRYVEGILKGWTRDHITTPGDLAARDEARRSNQPSPTSSQPYQFGNDALAAFPPEDL